MLSEVDRGFFGPFFLKKFNFSPQHVVCAYKVQTQAEVECMKNYGVYDLPLGTVSLIINVIQEGLTKKYVGVPGMNAICRALCLETGVYSYCFSLE